MNFICFIYTYDKSNRLLSSNTSGNIYKLENTYDKDGNILTLDRKGRSGNTIDSFAYDYYPSTNKLLSVRDGKEQFNYDANGNMTTDSLNKNTNIKYDHRNLIIQLKHKALPMDTADTLKFVTNYLYDEAGNRIRKTVYKFIGTTSAQENAQDLSNDSLWQLYNDEVYSRDVSGKELAIYKDNTAFEFPIYGLDLIGKIKGDEPFYYMKDHLGSVRAVINSSGDVVSAQDYDVWGYLLQDRVYDSDSNKFKFTGKERDVESGYDYFGARYYDSRIANWTSMDPLMEKHYDFSPYNYVLRNPLRLVDPDGKQVEIITRTYIPQESSVNPLYKVYHDNRSANYYSKNYRTEQRMVVVPNQNVSSDIITSYSSDIGITRANPNWNPQEVLNAPGEGVLGSPQATRVSETSVNVSIQGSAWETLIPGAPSIDYSVSFYVSENGDGTFNVIANGAEDGFPAYEIWARNLKTGGNPILIYNRENVNVIPEIRNLLPWLGDTDINGEGLVR